MEGFLLRLQAQFPSTVSTVYRCVCVSTRGGVGVSAEPGAGAGVKPGFRLPLCPVCHPSGPVRSWSRPPGTAVPLAPAACSVCVCWTSIPLVRVEGEGHWCVGVGVQPQEDPQPILPADSATAFGAQTQDCSQMQSPTPPAEAPTVPCCSTEVGRAQNCFRGTRPCGR